VFIPTDQLRELESRYRSFPSFTEWEQLRFDDRRWADCATRLDALRQQAQEATLARAGEVAVRAADGDVGTARLVAELASSGAPATVPWICRLHVLMCSRQDVYTVNTPEGPVETPLQRGHFKSVPNYGIDSRGGTYPFAPVQRVAGELERLVQELASDRFLRAHPVLQASYACNGILAVHPFADGNARVANVLASVYQHRAVALPVVLFGSHRAAYRAALEASARGEHRPMVELFLRAGIDTMTFVQDILQSWPSDAVGREGRAISAPAPRNRSPDVDVGSLVDLPKVDLHVHLEGSIRPATLIEIGERHGAALPPGLSGKAYAFTYFQEFVDNCVAVCRCLKDEEDFARIAYELCADEAAQGVRYAEVTFTPVMHAVRLDNGWDMPIAAVLEGFARGETDFGIRCRLVLEHARTFPTEMADHTLRAAIRHRDAGVVALGLGGDEAIAPERFGRVFSEAVDSGLHSVPHAGEMAGPANIRGAIRALHAERIGHGIRVLEDPELVGEARHRGIALEVCPTSNVATGVVYSLAQHPLPDLLAAGLTVTLGSDHPAVFSSPIAGEYEIARRVFGMDDAALAEMARTGVRSSFLDDGSKNSIEAEIDEWLRRPTSGNGSPA